MGDKKLEDREIGQLHSHLGLSFQMMIKQTMKERRQSNKNPHKLAFLLVQSHLSAASVGASSCNPGISLPS
jgi:hypothetical protein